MKDKDKIKIYLITALLDSGLIYLCTKKKLHHINSNIKYYSILSNW